VKFEIATGLLNFSLEFLDLLSFFSLSFRKTGQKRACFTESVLLLSEDLKVETLNNNAKLGDQKHSW